MSIFTKLFACVFGLGLVFSAGCAGGKTPTKTDLLHHRFVLESVDGQPFKSAMRTPDIEFGEGFQVSGVVCNRYIGAGELSGKTLTVKQMASTKMLCPDEALNKLEFQFGQMLMEGAEVELTDNKTLTIRQGGHTLVYTLSDRVQ